MERHDAAHRAIPDARLLARLTVARVRLLEATTLRDRRAKELRELIAAAHEATADPIASIEATSRRQAATASVRASSSLASAGVTR